MLLLLHFLWTTGVAHRMSHLWFLVQPMIGVYFYIALTLFKLMQKPINIAWCALGCLQWPTTHRPLQTFSPSHLWKKRIATTRIIVWTTTSLILQGHLKRTSFLLYHKHCQIHATLTHAIFVTISPVIPNLWFLLSFGSICIIKARIHGDGVQLTVSNSVRLLWDFMQPTASWSPTAYPPHAIVEQDSIIIGSWYFITKANFGSTGDMKFK